MWEMLLFVVFYRICFIFFQRYGTLNNVYFMKIDRVSMKSRENLSR